MRVILFTEEIISKWCDVSESLKNDVHVIISFDVVEANYTCVCVGGVGGGGVCVHVQTMYINMNQATTILD